MLILRAFDIDWIDDDPEQELLELVLLMDCSDLDSIVFSFSRINEEQEEGELGLWIFIAVMMLRKILLTEVRRLELFY